MNTAEKLPEPFPPTRTVYPLQITGADGRPAVIMVSPKVLKRIKTELHLAAMPWYRRLPLRLMRTLGYWTGLTIRALVRR